MVPSFSLEWKAKVTADSNITSTIGNGGIYVGSAGTITRFASNEPGKEQAVYRFFGDDAAKTPSLTYNGTNNILVAGINGTVLGLDGSSLDTKFDVRFSDDRLVSVILALQDDGLYIYAGINGTIFAIDFTGNLVSSTHPIEGLDSPAWTTLSSSSGKSPMFFAGIEGWVVALKTESLDVIWKARLEHASGYTFVAGNDDVLYAGSRGRLYVLNPKDGKNTGMVDLGYTSGGVDVQITFDEKYVYAGINGWAACLDPRLNIQYFNKITDARGSTNVLVLQDGRPVLANKGGVFLLDDKGQTVASYDLTAYYTAGGASLSYKEPGDFGVGIGPTGYFLYLSISD